ncbi:MAG: monovalent cation/H(+) antiporter subunit G [Syntrophorhabdaceae bacterium]|nr:monovalent cation/H(+) antiporter subunit G [Syntrophorhabdaceae bacterium]
MTYIAGIFILAGVFFFLAATVGFLRFPDLYTRMHATGKGDTLGLLLCIVGLALYNGCINQSWNGLVQGVKIISIAIFWFIASPTATHALLRAAFESGVKPWTKDGVVVIDKGEDGKET